MNEQCSGILMFSLFYLALPVNGSKEVHLDNCGSLRVISRVVTLDDFSYSI